MQNISEAYDGLDILGAEEVNMKFSEEEEEIELK